MIELHVDKTLVESYLLALVTGTAIEAPPGLWSNNDLAILAGCGLAVVEREKSQLSPPQQSAADPELLTNRQRIREFKTAIDVVRELANFVLDDSWDNYLPPVEEVVVDHSRPGGDGVRYVRLDQSTDYFD